MTLNGYMGTIVLRLTGTVHCNIGPYKRFSSFICHTPIIRDQIDYNCMYGMALYERKCAL